MFSFKYSPRTNTASLSMNDPVPEEEKGRRLAMLQEKQRQIQEVRNAALIGETFEVLVSGKSRRENQWSGHTSSHRVLNFTSLQKELLGHYVQVRLPTEGPIMLMRDQVIKAAGRSLWKGTRR